jgi:hypothetical protein
MLPAISHNCHDSWMQRRTESFLCIAKNDDSIGALRKALSILLLAMFCLPAITPLFALQAQEDANLPACCRRHGKHHCMMSMQDRQAMTASQDPQFAAPTEKCPYAPSMVVRGVHLSSFVPQPPGRDHPDRIETADLRNTLAPEARPSGSLHSLVSKPTFPPVPIPYGCGTSRVCVRYIGRRGLLRDPSTISLWV